MASRTELPPRFGRYVIVKKIGEGGMGAVYLAEDTQLGRRVAIKVPHFSSDDDPRIIGRFQREARVAAGIDHAGICPVYDIGEIGGIHYLTMPFIEGASLSDKLRNEGPLPPGEAVRLILRLALAVHIMHQRGVIYRDLKPGNILLKPGGEPVVMDFGLARSFSGLDRVTATGSPVGTPSYMSPEQLMGQQAELGPATDVYSLGVILFELLTGQVPFAGSIHAVYAQILHAEPALLSQFRPELDPALDAVCRKALAKNSASRYASMAEFAAALEPFAGVERTVLPPPTRVAAVEQTVPNLLDPTLQTGMAEGHGVKSAPPAGNGSAGTEDLPPAPQTRLSGRFWLWRTLLLIGAAAVACGILLVVLHQMGLFERPQDVEDDPLERIRAGVQLHASKDPRQADTFQGKPRHNYSVWIEAPAEVLDQIEKAEYHFDRRLFSLPIPRVGSSRHDGFMTVYVGTGAVDRDMDVVLVLKDGNTVTLKFNVYRAIFGE